VAEQNGIVVVIIVDREAVILAFQPIEVELKHF
jgi:hypothetical protein